MIDVVDVVRSYLLTVAGVTTQVSTRIYGPPGLPVGYTGSTKTLVLLPQGAPQESGLPVQWMPFQMRCYGPDPDDAYAVYGAVHDALHDMGAKSVTLSDATVVIIAKAARTGGPTYMREPVTEWHMWLAYYEIALMDRATG